MFKIYLISNSNKSNQLGTTPEVTCFNPKPHLDQWTNGPLTIVNYVFCTHQSIILKCAIDDAQFMNDSYVQSHQVKSVMCIPILLQSTLKVPNCCLPTFLLTLLKGIMFLENNLCPGLYSKSKVDLLMVLTSQMAISFERIKFLNEQVEKQTEKIRHPTNFYLFFILHCMPGLNSYSRKKNFKESADSAEKYKLQLENFIDMICHEIRNPYVIITNIVNSY
jgi:hypothetical protein